VLDVQIAGADAAQSHPYHRIPGIEDNGLGFVGEGKFTVFDVS
jgi:hypothetical protein